MYRKILFSLIILIVTLSFQNSFAKKSSKVEKQHDKLFEFIQEEIKNISLNLKKNKRGNIAISDIKDFVVSVENYRKKNGYQTPEQEIYADSILESMKIFTLNDKFEQKNCEEYKKTFESHFKQSGPGERFSISSDFNQIWIWLCK